MRRALLLMLMLFQLALGQEAGSSPSPSPTPEASPTAIPLAEITTELESASMRLRELEQRLADDPPVTAIGTELPILTGEVDRRTGEIATFALSSPSLESVRTLEEEWRGLSGPLADWRQVLTDRATQLSQEVDRLTELESSWKETLDLARQSQVPETLLTRTGTLLDQIVIARRQVELRRTALLALQDQVSIQEARIREALESIGRLRSQAADRVWQQDGPPLWSADSYRASPSELVYRLTDAVEGQWTLLGSYARTNAGRFILHLALFGVLTLAFYWVREHVRPDEPTLAHSLQIFQAPITLALVIAVWCSGRFYPDAPPILKAWLVAIALVPISRLLRRMISPALRPVLTFLVIMFFVDQVRTLAAALPVVSRMLMLSQMLVCLGFLYWRRIDFRQPRLAWLAARVTMVAFGVAILANVVGFVALGDLVGSATLESLYLAMVLYAVLTILDGLVLLAMLVWPLNRLSVVKRHQTLLRTRIHGLLRFLAVLLWTLVTLENLNVLRPLLAGGRSVLEAGFSIGSLRIVLDDVLAFFLILWAAALLSRFARFVLEEDVYPRLQLSRGLPYAMSSILHYTLLLIGFLMAMAALGVDTNRFTVLAGAFGVGIGFGMQNIVNNFVSGLIMLFERPVKVGDMIKLGEFTGTLTRIGLRASVVHTWDGSDVIVPNGDLLSNRVVNWTMARRASRRVDIQVGVAYDSDPRQVIAVLERVTAEHEAILKDPPPEAVMLEFADNALLFQLRANTRDKNWTKVRSDVMLAVYEAFAAEGIDMPFPQRTVHFDDRQLRRLAGAVRAEPDAS